jgi:hypothetical protein
MPNCKTVDTHFEMQIKYFRGFGKAVRVCLHRKSTETGHGSLVCVTQCTDCSVYYLRGGRLILVLPLLLTLHVLMVWYVLIHHPIPLH